MSNKGNRGTYSGCPLPTYGPRWYADAKRSRREADDRPTTCDGPICVECCVCRDCGRKVGTPHIDVCACPPTAMHWRCDACAAARVASVLTEYDHG